MIGISYTVALRDAKTSFRQNDDFTQVKYIIAFLARDVKDLSTFCGVLTAFQQKFKNT